MLHTRIVTDVGGGPDKTILNSPRYLQDFGYDSACLYLHPNGDPGIEVLKQKAIESEAEMIAWPDGKPIDFELVKRLSQFCKDRNVAIWHAHDYKTNVLGLQVRRHWPMKLVTTTHGWGVVGGRNHLYATVGKACLPFYDAVVAVSDDLYLSSRRWRVSKKRAYMIQNAIDTHSFRRTLSRRQARTQLQLNAHDGIVILALGRLSAEKGFDILIDSVAELHSRGCPVTLWIGGEGGCRGILEAQIERLGLSQSVRLMGHVIDPRIMLQAADIFVLSSISEGLPNVLLEAMALETPIVATRIGGVPRLLGEGQYGVMVDPGNRDALADAIHDLANDPDRRSAFAAAARNHVIEEFAFEKRMQKMAAVYDQVLE
ncbi:glycosyltransferase [Novipirellula artificiosorum]|uniref:glycosyltransferase n=1 Tax=Novipirellula artificiosorum TaxID=2528016 RepID=UPI0018CF2ACC|nr:glycosyltransferase [Novipirellula artificiosorum]